MKRRREQGSDSKGGQNDLKKQKLNDSRTQEERLKDSTIPLWNIAYDKQVLSLNLLFSVLTLYGF